MGKILGLSSYDFWKLSSPYDDNYEEEDEDNHKDDYDEEDWDDEEEHESRRPNEL